MLQTDVLSLDMCSSRVLQAQRGAPVEAVQCVTTYHALLLTQRLDFAFMAAAARAAGSPAEGAAPHSASLPLCLSATDVLLWFGCSRGCAWVCLCLGFRTLASGFRTLALFVR